MNNTKKVNISFVEITNGINIKIDNKKLNLVYPKEIWNSFFKLQLRGWMENLVYLLSFHIGLLEKNLEKKIVYHFSTPNLEPLIFKGMLYEFANSACLKTSDQIRKVFNLESRTSFSKKEFIYANPTNANAIFDKKNALIPFTFGKDSLLTYGLLKELGFKNNLIFFRENLSSHENIYKKKLTKIFQNEFCQKITTFSPGTSNLKTINNYKNLDTWYGWDLLLTQYFFLSIPFLFVFKTKYFCFSNEQSCNYTYRDKENFLLNPDFEQSGSWLKTINSSFLSGKNNPVICSIIEPLHEIAVIYILHHRYPKLAKYQHSCFGNTKKAGKKSWCGQCSKCARNFIFILANGYDPKDVGLNTDMLQISKKNLYSIFEGKTKESIYDTSGLGRDEQLLAFYLAYKRGIKGTLIKEFEKKYLTEAKKRKKELFEVFYTLHSNETMPQELQLPVLKIFKRELKVFKKYF